MKFKSLEIVKWVKDPEKKGLMTANGTLSYGEIFENLEAHLEESGFLPGNIDYFELNWSVLKDNCPSFDAHYEVDTQYGGSEGIYIDIWETIGWKRERSIMTIKSLDSSADEIVRMYRIAAEIYLYLNNDGHEFAVSDI